MKHFDYVRELRVVEKEMTRGSWHDEIHAVGYVGPANIGMMSTIDVKHVETEFRPVRRDEGNHLPAVSTYEMETVAKNLFQNPGARLGVLVGADIDADISKPAIAAESDERAMSGIKPDLQKRSLHSSCPE